MWGDAPFGVGQTRKEVSTFSASCNYFVLVAFEVKLSVKDDAQ